MERITQSGRFFREGSSKWKAWGVSYGPFPPDRHGDFFPEPERAGEDFRAMRRIGLNAIRVYHVPPPWLLDLAGECGIRLFITLPWPRRGLFLESRREQERICRDLEHGVRELGNHAAVFACAIDNEMAPDLTRWLGPGRVRQFLDDLIDACRQPAPDILFTYAGYPPTEYLLPEHVDFLTFNVYLHDREAFRAYLRRLHHLAGERPLLIGEFGIDVFREGEARQAEILGWHVEEVAASGASGSFLFAWTDEWFTGGHSIEGWAFGLTDRDRRPRPVCAELGRRLASDRCQPEIGEEWPLISVVICTYNGARTLADCLKAVGSLCYPDYEVIVVNDGSTDKTAAILDTQEGVRVIHQANQGLSAARNRGAAEARGEIIAYTDDDCMPDEDWLYFLARTFRSDGWAAVGGPNLAPSARNRVEAAVAAAPGSPTHVLLNDEEAEHIPGCNFAIRREVLVSLGGFDPVHRQAGDDVDLCWRMQEAGLRVGFNPAAVVWHYRRSTVDAYFKQQRGYGKAEAMLRYQHPNAFDASGAALWRGEIYDRRDRHFAGTRPLIYHGVFALGYFQSVYGSPVPAWIAYCGSLEWLLLALALVGLVLFFPFLGILPVLMLVLTVAAAVVSASTARLERGHDDVKSRAILIYLCLLQPWLRAWARYFTWLEEQRTPAPRPDRIDSGKDHMRAGRLRFWLEAGQSRMQFLEGLVGQLRSEEWRFVVDSGWSPWDIHVFASPWWHVRIRSVSEVHPEEKQLLHVEMRREVTRFSWLLGTLLGGGLVVASVVIGPALLGVLIGAVAFLLWLWHGIALERRIRNAAVAVGRQLDLLLMEKDGDGS